MKIDITKGIKVGQVVKLKNPKNREKKRRWRVEGFYTAVDFAAPEFATPPSAMCRRLDAKTHRLAYYRQDLLVPISFWERITKRF